MDDGHWLRSIANFELYSFFHFAIYGFPVTLTMDTFEGNYTINCVFVTFPYGVPGQVRYLIVSLPDHCLRIYFKSKLFKSMKVIKKAKIKNIYNQVPNLNRNIIRESEKNTRKHHTQATTRLQGTNKTVWQRLCVTQIIKMIYKRNNA